MKARDSFMMIASTDSIDPHSLYIDDSELASRDKYSLYLVRPFSFQPSRLTTVGSPVA